MEFVDFAVGNSDLGLGGPISSTIRIFLWLVCANVIWFMIPTDWKDGIVNTWRAITSKKPKAECAEGEPVKINAELSQPSPPPAKLSDVLNKRIAVYKKALPHASETLIVQFIRDDVSVSDASILEQDRLAGALAGEERKEEVKS